VLFYIWILFSVCGGAVAFSNKPFRQRTIHNNLTHPTWMICKCVMAWCRRRLLERMYTRSCLLIVGAPHHKKNKLQPDSRHLNLALLQLKKTFNVFDTFCDFCSSQNDKICWLLSLLLDVLRKDLISWPFWFFKMFWTYHADLRALFFTAGLFYSDWNGLSIILALTSDLRL